MLVRNLAGGPYDLGRTPADVGAVVLTSAHFDHVGSDRHVHRTWDVPDYTHEGGRSPAVHPYPLQAGTQPAVDPIRMPRRTAEALRPQGHRSITRKEQARCIISTRRNKS
ncbi:MBL fold metallo-hydrolase [Nocardia carnea]|uniref:MBL fold metallo-hydrolase n=1 Tax=Nocardia carnea TaxID=37328 RepID=UPI002455D6CD|nr:MBL fold metallo-hydrolase [Nocardia carnea]